MDAITERKRVSLPKPLASSNGDVEKRFVFVLTGKQAF